MKYLYTIMDDRSRFIVGNVILYKKNCKQCIEILSENINEYGQHLIMWDDNRGENTGL